MSEFTSLNDVDPKFANKIRASVRNESDLERLVVTSNSVAFIKHATQPGVTPLGCVLCIGAEITKTSNGPQIGKDALIPYHTLVDLPEHFGDELKSNLWACPRCKLPIMKLLPKFVAKK